MTRPPDHPQVVLVYADGAASADAGTVRRLAERGVLSGEMSGSEFLSGEKSVLPEPENQHRVMVLGDSRRVADPHEIQRQFPQRWRAYIRANYRNLGHVQRVFGVSEKAARNWWNGDTGANGAQVAIAVNEHPVAAPRMLFAAE
ncbi:MAG: hypothetical protein QNJ44_22670 [Rhodobacter sp.]|nr:hypothetical protein [Rhodobacter sp.]